ncbi:MAG: hypothetical protein ACE5EX_08435, partial [Phycisphaerae bacterium]
VVAAGDELLFFDPADLDSPTRRLTIQGDAGSIRSIQAADGDDGRPILLLGAATGVYRLPIDRAEPDLTLLVDPAPQVRGGFNAAVTVGDRVFASHSELGLCEWRVGEPDNPTPRFESLTRQAGAVRGVHFFDGDLLCAIDDRIIRWPADGTTDKPAHIYSGSTSTITAVRPTSTGLFVGNGDGDVLHYPRDGDRSAQEAPLGASVSSATPAERSAPPAGSDGSGTAGPPVATGHKATLEAGSTRTSKPVRLHTGTNRPVESLWLLTTHGVRRLVYTDTSLHVHARVLGDTFACRYEAGGQTLRRVEVAPDLLVATNDLRDRLICWTPGRPASPSATIPVSRLCGRSIQDVCLVPRA